MASVLTALFIAQSKRIISQSNIIQITSQNVRTVQVDLSSLFGRKALYNEREASGQYPPMCMPVSSRRVCVSECHALVCVIISK